MSHGGFASPKYKRERGLEKEKGRQFNCRPNVNTIGRVDIPSYSRSSPIMNSSSDFRSPASLPESSAVRPRSCSISVS